jgi:hypothetical protein
MTVKIVSGSEKRTTFRKDVQLDTSRDTAILIRQSGKGANIRHYESRLLQESLIPFVMETRGESDLSHVRIYDEGAGVSGRKGIDKRLVLRQLHYDLADNIIGDIVLARADRLFRDKHFDKVSTFTLLAERMGIKVIVPSSQGVIVYDLRNTKDLQTFQQDMQAAYAYIENQIGYMARARENKVLRGFYGGGCLLLPYVLLRDMPKEEQVPVVYRPWQEIAIDLFQKFAEFNFETGRMARYVEGKPFLFPYMPPSDLEVYKPVTNLRKVDGGYTFATLKSLFLYLSNLTLGGFAHGGKDEAGNTFLIANAFEAAVPLDLLEPSYAAITGEYLDGTPYEKPGSRRQFRRYDGEIDAILHGLLTSDDGPMSAFARLGYKYPIYTAIRGGYLGQTTTSGLGRILKAWTLPSPALDDIILSRLIALAEYDNGMVDRIRAYFAAVSSDGASRLMVLDTAIRKTQAAIKKLSRAIVLLSESEGGKEEEKVLDPDDPIVKEHRKLSATLRNLQKQRDEAAIEAKEDPAQSIQNFYHVLSHLRAEFHKRPPQTKKDIMRKLIEEVKVNIFSPHLFTLHITWIRPMSSVRDDVAFLWRSDPTQDNLLECWSEEEEKTLRTFYPQRPQVEVMQAIPYKTPGQIKKRAMELGIKRDRYNITEQQRFYYTVSYADLQAAAEYTESVAERDMLWEEINAMADSTRRGQLGVMWFMPLDIVSFSHALAVTSVNEGGLLPGYH